MIVNVNNNMYLNIILLVNMGLTAGKMEPFIVGGDYTDIRQYPYSTFIYVDCKNTFVCGGSILSNHILLTAAHCLYDCLNGQTKAIIMNFGHSSIYKMHKLIVSKFSVHEKYVDEKLEHDIALMYVSTSIPFGDFAKRVAVVSRFPTRATGGHVTGWGVINSQNEMTLDMKFVYQELQDRKVCEGVVDVPRGTFCAKSNKKEEHPEQGDSGGALVVYNFIQIGIVSFKHVEYDTVIYTNVTYYYNWVKSHAKRLSCTKSI